MFQQPITPHSDHPFFPLSPNLVGLLGTLGDVNDLEGCKKKKIVSIGSALDPDSYSGIVIVSKISKSNSESGMVQSQRTRGKGLLELVGLVGILQDKGVEVGRAADLELGLLGLAVLLDTGG
jgi:hypothetical protein